MAVIREHYALVREAKPERWALVEFRKHLAGYLRGFRNAKSMRHSLMTAPDEGAFLRLLNDLDGRETSLPRAG